MNDHPVQWIAPQPLWGRFAAAGDAPGSASALKADDQYRPSLLRFASDDFMNQLFATLDRDPRQIASYLARPETWRNPMNDGVDLVDYKQVPQPAKALRRLFNAEQPRTAVTAVAKSATDSREAQLGLSTPRAVPLKLYQPIQQRHYLVSAGLVCGIPGFPDRTLASGGRERIGFVVRRLLPSATAANALEECAYIKDTAGPRWQRTGTLSDDVDAQLVDGEELLPLFAVNFADDTGHPRRLLAGTIPTGRREDYFGVRVEAKPQAPSNGATAPINSVAARKEQFKAEVSEPWKNLVRNAVKAEAAAAEGAASSDPPTQAQKDASRKSTNLQMQMQSWLILLDFADYLYVHLPKVWSALLAAPDGSHTLPNSAENALYQWLGGAKMTTALKNALQGWSPSNAVATSLGEALIKVRDKDQNDATRKKLEAATTAYGATSAEASAWPSFHFLLAGLDTSDQASGPYSGLTQPSASSTSTLDGAFDITEDEDAKAVGAAGSTASTMQTESSRLDGLVKMVVAALPASTEQDGKAPPIPFAAKLQRDAISSNITSDPGLFVIRCVYQRCDCGPLYPAKLSRSSQQFQIASFFDPDAPARQIRITLPLDTTPAGLRKFSRNTAFQISDVLCGQVTRAKNMGFGDLVRSVLPWPFHKDLSADVGDLSPCQSGGVNIGMICSLSIPIITICAFILLMMIVLILDIIFRWIPYFIICFPLPKFKAKGATA
jgi:hypothetical protein